MLEARGLPIGVVTNIVGIRRVQIEGQPDHAGTTPWTSAATRWSARPASSTAHRGQPASGKPHYVVATVGRLSLTPNAANAVPGRVELTLEMRSDSDAVLDAFPETLMAGGGDLHPLPERPQPLSDEADRAVATAGRHARVHETACWS